MPPSTRPSDDLSRVPSAGGTAGRKIGPYRLEDQLGAGGMGAVYRAFDERLERPVALKQILADVSETSQNRRRFRREAQMAARLNHPSIVRVHDILAEDDGDWIVMELVEGRPLSSLLADGRLPLEHALRYGLEIAEALGAAHQEGIVHRDLKANNILVTDENRVKILDFGLAKRVVYGSAEQVSAAISVDGQILGTPHAMSPEQALGRKVGLASDLFSFGALLYEMCTGSSPFRAANAIETLSRICHHHPPPVQQVEASVPAVLSELIDRLLQKHPAHRPSGAWEAADTLQKILENPASYRPRPTPAAGATAGGQVAAEPTADFTLAGHGKTRSHTLGERRQVTLLCCELTSAAEDNLALTAESLAPVVRDFETLARRVVERYEGHVAQVLSHRLIVYFGFPQRQEDDAWRAVRAAIDLLDLRSELTSGTGGQEVSLRTAVHAGPAILQAGGTTATSTTATSATAGELLLGATLDVAITLLQSAAPGQLWVSDDIFKRVDRAFETEVLEPLKTPGQAEALPVYRIRGDRPEADGWRIETPGPSFIAREQEVELLLDRWQRTRDGRGQAVLVTGEAGIGKSRLVQSLVERLGAGPRLWVMAGSPHARNAPFHPVAGLLRQILEPAADSSITLTADAGQLEDLAREHGLDPRRTLPYLASLLRLTLPEGAPAAGGHPDQVRARTLEVVLELLAAMARAQPTLLLVEDLHWVDPSTLELLQLLLERMTALPLLALCTSRPELTFEWGPAPHLTQVALSRLPAADTRRLIKQVTGGKALPEDLESQIVSRTAGVPLFVEELTKTVLESGLLEERDGRYVLIDPNLDPSAVVPPTLRDSLAARLDRLGEAKEVVKLAAAIGSELRHDLLAAMSPLPPEELAQALDQLVAAEILIRKGFSRKRRYVFRHALIRETAYESLLKAQRRRLHQQITEVLEAQFPRTVEREPELLAHHCENGDLTEKAVGYLQLAGQRAVTESAHTEALHHFRHAIGLLRELPESDARDEQELTLHLEMSQPLIATSGFATEAVEQAYRRAQEISGQQAAEQGFVPPLLYRFWTLHIVRGTPGMAESLAEQVHEAGRHTEHPISVGVAAYAAGITAFYGGDFPRALEHMTRGAELYDPALSEECSALYGDDYLFYARMHQAWLQCLTGETAAGWRCAQDALAQAEALDNDYRTAFALVFTWGIGFDFRDPDEYRALLPRCMALAKERGFQYLQAVTEMYRGLDELSRGSPGAEEGVRGLVSAFGQQGADVLVPLSLVRLAHPLLKLGLIEEVLAATREALELSSRKPLCGYYDAEALRLQGRALLHQGDAERGEADLRRALDVARRQGARTFALRSAVDLGRRLADQGRIDEASKILAEELPVLSSVESASKDAADARELERQLSETSQPS